MYDDPAAWQAAIYGDGACILDWSNPGEIYDQLTTLKAIGCSTEELASRVRNAFTEARRPAYLPKIHVAKAARRVA